MTKKSIIEGLSDWIKKCPVINVVDIAQTAAGEEGLYKQPTIEVVPFIDGSEMRTEHWYVLFMKSSKLKKSRMADAEVCEAFEDWVQEKELDGDYPDIGYDVQSVGISDGYYMMEREENIATYMATITLTYIKE